MASFQPVRIIGYRSGKPQDLGRFTSAIVDTAEVTVSPGQRVLLVNRDDNWYLLGSDGHERVRFDFIEFTTFEERST